jgi:uncharacterized membrane protein
MMSVTVASLLFALVGILFIGLGIPLIQNRIPPNPYYGFRTKKSLSDSKIWYEINHISGIDLFIAGSLITITSLTMLVFAQGWKRENVTLTLLFVMVLTLTGAALHGITVLRRM